MPELFHGRGWFSWKTRPVILEKVRPCIESDGVVPPHKGLHLSYILGATTESKVKTVVWPMNELEGNLQCIIVYQKEHWSFRFLERQKGSESQDSGQPSIVVSWCTPSIALTSSTSEFQSWLKRVIRSLAPQTGGFLWSCAGVFFRVFWGEGRKQSTKTISFWKEWIFWWFFDRKSVVFGGFSYVFSLVFSRLASMKLPCTLRHLSLQCRRNATGKVGPRWGGFFLRERSIKGWGGSKVQRASKTLGCFQK